MSDQVKHTDYVTGIAAEAPTAQGIHILAKPMGPVCNLHCAYCFYLEKKVFFAKNENYRMTDRLLEAFVRKYIRANDLPEIPFAWQGGEPMLMGLDFFRKAVRLQNKHGDGSRITNALQTNGTLLTDEWCDFLAKNQFLVGLSLDGPDYIHNRYRVDGSGKGAFSAVMNGLKLMQKHGVEYNVLACITRESACRPREVYHFFKEQGARFIQFIPIVERLPDNEARALGLTLAAPPDTRAENTTDVTPWTVRPEDYGDFLIGVFEEWVRNDVGNIFVMNFEYALMAWMGGQATVCQFSRHCGRSVIMEHNGNIYSCDHFVYPPYLLGNILSSDPLQLVNSSKQKEFGRSKETALPQSCQDCDVLFACRGECLKHRFLTTLTGEPGLNYLCGAYKKFFRHINKYMKAMRALLENNQPASYIMDAVRGPLAIKLR